MSILSIECPYTSCSAKIGEVCTNARNGKPMPHGHKDRKQALRGAEKPKGHLLAMSYNAWQLVRLVACEMHYVALRDGLGEADNLAHLIQQLPPLNFTNSFANPRGRFRTICPKTYRQRFQGAVLVTLKKVMEEAALLNGGTFENTVRQLANRAQDIQVSTVDLLGSLARG